MAKIDTHFEAFLTERRLTGLSPAAEARFRDAWAALRGVPGSYRLCQDVVWEPAFHRLSYGQRRLLRPIFTWLHEQHLVPAFHFTFPKPQRVTGRPTLTPDEVAALCHAIDDFGIQAFAQLVYLTGLRARTLLALTPAHFDLGAQTVRIPLRGDDRWEVEVTLLPEAVTALRQWHRRRRVHSKTFFHLADGRPLTLQAASAGLRDAGRSLGRCVGFGHLQYAYARLLAARVPIFGGDVVEGRTQQPFRLKYLKIPDLYAFYRPLWGDPSYKRISPADYIMSLPDEGDL